MTTVNGTIFMTDDAKRTADNQFQYQSKPLEVAQSHIESALDHQNFNHNISISYDYSFDSDNYDDSDSDLVELRDMWRRYWLDGHGDRSDHFNTLLLDYDEWPNPDGAGGVSVICDGDDGYPRGGVLLDGVDAGHHDEDSDRYGPASDSVESTIRGIVHESGHQFGMVHSEGLRYDREYDVIITYATPMGCNAGERNQCDELCSSRETNEWDHYYGDCEVDDLCL